MKSVDLRYIALFLDSPSYSLDPLSILCQRHTVLISVWFVFSSFKIGNWESSHFVLFQDCLVFVEPSMRVNLRISLAVPSAKPALLPVGIASNPQIDLGRIAILVTLSAHP